MATIFMSHVALAEIRAPAELTHPCHTITPFGLPSLFAGPLSSGVGPAHFLRTAGTTDDKNDESGVQIHVKAPPEMLR